MPSIIPGYEYDIFISYRHKDNKYDGWVSEFVSNLKKEIASTFKEELSIYFDENPQDGLLEGQHVDKSLEGKLKCLVFIPILSQVYCDPNSFAWKNEFCAFNTLVAEDQFGMYIRLANGNVNSRILPIRIHELDQQDLKLIENELGGTLRSIDFIYRTPGVNRPLRAIEDEPKENLNHTFYRDQINKVANTIKSTIAGIRMMGSGAEKITPEAAYNLQAGHTGFTKKRIAITGIITALLLIAVLLYFQFKNSYSSTEPIDRSIAVLPFADLSPQHDQEYFSDGLSEELLNLLARIPDLKVISRTSAFSFKGKNEDVRVIGEKLGVAYILEGSVRKSNDKIRITAQLIQVSDGTHIWSKTFDRTMNDIFKVQDEIANTVVDELKISLGSGGDLHSASTNSDAYNLYLQGKYSFTNRSQKNVEQAIQYYKQAIDLDNNNANFWAALSLAYASQANDGYVSAEEGFMNAREAAEKAIAIDQNLPTGHYALATIKATYDWDWTGASADFQKAYSLDKANFGTINGMANLAFTLGRLDEAIALYKKALELDPLRIPIKINLGRTLMHASQPVEAMRLFKTVLEMNDKFPTAHYHLGLSYLMQGKPEAAIEEIEKETVEDWKMQGLALANYGANKNAKADSLLQNFIKEYQQVSAFQIAEIYGYRNDPDKTFEWLEKAYDLRDGGLTTIIDNHWFSRVKSDPRYIPFLEKMKLPVSN
jgi:TolB-like protein/cytochrome c-type biogenesis protein CcmH/NrfG